MLNANVLANPDFKIVLIYLLSKIQVCLFLLVKLSLAVFFLY